jgi:hypothetical protein
MSTCTCPPGTLLGMPITPHRDCPIHGRPRGPITTDPTDLTPAEKAAAEALAADFECSWHIGCDEECHTDRARAVVAAVRGPIAAEALREVADGTRFPSHWILFRRNDGSGVTVSDLLRETAARHEGTTR